MTLEKRIEKRLYEINDLLVGGRKSTLRRYQAKVHTYSITNCGWINYRAQEFLMGLIRDAILNKSNSENKKL